MVWFAGRFYELAWLYVECFGKLPHGGRPGVDVMVFEVAYRFTRKAAALLKLTHSEWVILPYPLEVR
jgi:hypothetical protein